MAIFQYADLDFQSVTRILNLPDGTAPQHPATVAQLNNATLGLGWKDNVRVASFANVNLAAPGATIDGVSLVNGDRAVLAGQTNSAENGIYVWSASASPLVRASDADTSDKLENAVVTVDEGSNAGVVLRQTSVNFVLDTGAVVWANFFPSAPAATETTPGIIEIATQGETDGGLDDSRAITPLKLANSPFAHKGYAVDIGNGSLSTFTITHNLGTRDVLIQVRRNSGNFDYIDVEVRAATINTATVVFVPGLAPSTNAFRVLVSKVA